MPFWGAAGYAVTSGTITDADTLDTLDSNDFLQVVNDLSDTNSASTSRTNLELMDQRQAETATAAGTITGSGNATVVITAAGVTGSPITKSVAVALNDTAATWAGKVRTALNADANITALYTVGGSSTSITLTRTVAAAHDPTLNINLNNGTCTGITPAATSANTTAGILTPGVAAGVADGYAGADLTGMTTITETGAAATVQAVIEALITRLKAVTDSASGGDLIGMTAITELGANATAQSQMEALVTYAGGLIAAANALVYKGVLDCSGNPNYPAGDCGDCYIVSADGKVGGASGVSVTTGDLLLCNTDATASGDQATVGTKWNLVERNLNDVVIGPASATDHRIPQFNGTTGESIEENAAIVTDQSLQITSASGLTLGLDAAGGVANTPGTIKMFSSGDDALYNTITAGDNSANATYTLPLAMPGGNAVLQSTSGGVLSWETPAVTEVSKDLVGTAPVTINGGANVDNCLPGADADITIAVSAASESAAGVVELATSAEINTGTDATRAMSPDAFQASNRNIRYIVWRAVAVGTSTAAAEATILESVPSPVSGVIQTPYADNDTAGVTGTATYDIHLGGTTIMTTTKISIETGETSSRTATTPPALTTTAVTAGQVFTLHCDAVQSGTAAKGLVFTIPILET